MLLDEQKTEAERCGYKRWRLGGNNQMLLQSLLATTQTAAIAELHATEQLNTKEKQYFK